MPQANRISLTAGDKTLVLDPAKITGEGFCTFVEVGASQHDLEDHLIVGDKRNTSSGVHRGSINFGVVKPVTDSTTGLTSPESKCTIKMETVFPPTWTSEERADAYALALAAAAESSVMDVVVDGGSYY